VAIDMKGNPGRFYAVRRRFYKGLLIFIVVVGLPIVGVPKLRRRLFQRTMAIKSAISNDTIPARSLVGENKQPFPAEFERLEPPLPKLPPAPLANRIEDAKRPSRAMPRVSSSQKKEPMPEVFISTESPAKETPETVEEGPKYQKGPIEQSAYDLLIQSSPAVAKLVQGGNPSLHFVSWDAAGRGDDIYWVRLKFRSEGNPDIEYIWRVKVQSKEVTPLSHNARENF
jgi:hypothetical protein